MAYAVPVPVDIWKILADLKTKYPDWNWTTGIEIGVEGGRFLQASNSEVARKVVFKLGADIMELASKLTAPPIPRKVCFNPLQAETEAT